LPSGVDIMNRMELFAAKTSPERARERERQSDNRQSIISRSLQNKNKIRIATRISL